MAKTSKLIGRSNWLTILLLIGILLLGNKLRFFSYSLVPHPGEVADEYAYAWLGLSLIQEGKPIAWTGITDAYKEVDSQRIDVDTIYAANPERSAFQIVTPWFDSPPIFGLLIGYYSHFRGITEFVQTGTEIIRRPMLYVGVLTTVLIYVFAKRLYGTSIGLFSALLYSIIPTVVISSRLVVTENGYVPLFLGSLIMAFDYFKKRKIVYWNLASLLAGIALLFKLSAIAIPIALILLAILYGKKKRNELIKKTAYWSLASLMVFVLYGWYFDWETFVSVFRENTGRFYGASSEVFYQALVHPKITANKFLTDGWIILGWISVFLVSAREWQKTKGGNFLTIGIFSYLVIFLLFGSEPYGWYRFPFYPFLVISIAVTIQKIIKSSNMLIFFSLMLLPFGTTVHRLVGVMDFQKYTGLFRLSSLLFFLLFAANILSQKRKWVLLQKLFMIGGFIFVVWLSIKQIYYFTYDTWFFVT